MLATDYDGTLARQGRVGESTVRALERLRSSGRSLVMVTGRELEDLRRVFNRLDLFDRVIAENGPVLFNPSTGRVTDLAPPPPRPLVEALRRRGVPFSEGRTILATLDKHREAAVAAIAETAAGMTPELNKGSLMLLPAGHDKGTGLATALKQIGLSGHNTVGVGDGENDLVFLASCELGVAVSSAVPTLIERADWVTPGGAGEGVEQLAARLAADDLAEIVSQVPRLRRSSSDKVR